MITRDCIKGQHGFILLPVAVALALIAALAVLINRSASVNMDMVAGRVAVLRARYVAEAAESHAKWFLKNDCAYRAPIQGLSFSGHTYHAALNDNSDGTIHIAATGVLDSGLNQTLADNYRCEELIHKALYWSDWSEQVVRRAELDGSGVTDLLTAANGLTAPKSLKIDTEAEKIYWADGNMIRRSNVDGSGVVDVIDCGAQCEITALALDSTGGKIYWADNYQDEIYRANLDGTGAELLINSGISEPTGLDIEPNDGQMYWVDSGNWSIMRADLDGSNVQTESSGVYRPLCVTIDPVDRRLYIYDEASDTLFSVNYNGGGSVSLVTLTVSTQVHAIAINREENKIYWANETDKKIQRAGIDGSSQEDILVFNSGSNPWGLDLGPARPVEIPRSKGPYWVETDQDIVRRSELDGANVVDIVPTQDQPRSLKVDPAGERLYWSDNNKDLIRSSTVKGTDITTVIDCNLEACSQVDGLALDSAGGKVYWVDQGSHQIFRANLDGSNPEVLVSTGVKNPTDIALDLPGGKMYWGDEGTKSIMNANLDGTGITTIVFGMDKPYAIAVDPVMRELYWYEHNSRSIYRSGLDGSGTTVIVGSGNSRVRRIALDLDVGKMYWTDYDQQKIKRANLDGSFVEELIVTLGKPWGIVIVPGS